MHSPVTMSSPDDSRVTQLLTDCSPELLRFFRRRVRPEDDAADLLAELCVVVWRRRSAVPTLDEEARMWLYGVARNTLRNWARGRHRQREQAVRLREQLRAHAGPPDLDEVRDAIARLPENQAELVRLVHWDGFSVVEAAKILGLSESTARGRYQRARNRLAEDPQIAALRRVSSQASDETRMPSDSEIATRESSSLPDVDSAHK